MRDSYIVMLFIRLGICHDDFKDYVCEFTHCVHVRLRLPGYLDDLAKQWSRTESPDQPARTKTDWDEWGRFDSEADWEETETSKMYSKTYQDRRREAW